MVLRLCWCSAGAGVENAAAVYLSLKACLRADKACRATARRQPTIMPLPSSTTGRTVFRWICGVRSATYIRIHKNTSQIATAARTMHYNTTHRPSLHLEFCHYHHHHHHHQHTAGHERATGPGYAVSERARSAARLAARLAWAAGPLSCRA